MISCCADTPVEDTGDQRDEMPQPRPRGPDGASQVLNLVSRLLALVSCVSRTAIPLCLQGAAGTQGRPPSGGWSCHSRPEPGRKRHRKLLQTFAKAGLSPGKGAGRSHLLSTGQGRPPGQAASVPPVAQQLTLWA